MPLFNKLRGIRNFVRRPGGQGVYVLDAARTAVGSPYKGLKNIPVFQLAGTVIKEIVHRQKIRKDFVDEVIFGNTVSAGTGQNFTRQAALWAGLPAAVRAYTVNSVCGSGLQSVILGAQSIQLGQSEFVIAGGAESASQSPGLTIIGDVADGQQNKVLESLVHDGLRCQITGKHMGELCEDLAQQQNISRADQDAYALQSHQKTVAAQAQDKFHREIVPVMVAKNRVFYEDERPRRNIALEKLQSLSPAFRKGGTVTAGNSSAPADGAGAVLLASREVVEHYQVQGMARVLGYAFVAVEPEEVFSAGVDAVKECLRRSQLAVRDIDLFEVSESFAAQAIYTRRQLNIPEGKMNIFGGDIALGHPLGAAGTRILVTLLHALKDQNKKRGMACVCLGGGGAVALAVETV